MLENCKMCPHMCGVNRKEKLGRCKCPVEVKLALVDLFMNEEPCISGEEGSGTVFFSGCNLNCVFCQNYEISQLGKGKTISIERLAEIFLELQNKKANNINLVTPTTYIEQIIEAIKIAKKNGLSIPIIYNSNGYERIEMLKKLEGYIDVYLPDLKYLNNDLAKEYSNINNYPSIAKEAILEMYRQAGSPVLDENGIIKKGVIIRHLILPNNIANTKNVLKWIKENIDGEVYISVMAQYFPTYKAKEMDMLNRKITKEEYDEVMDYVDELEFTNGYFQELGEHEEEYVPNFDFSNI